MVVDADYSMLHLWASLPAFKIYREGQNPLSLYSKGEIAPSPPGSYANG